MDENASSSTIPGEPGGGIRAQREVPDVESGPDLSQLQTSRERSRSDDGVILETEVQLVK